MNNKKLLGISFVLLLGFSFLGNYTFQEYYHRYSVRDCIYVPKKHAILEIIKTPVKSYEFMVYSYPTPVFAKASLRKFEKIIDNHNPTKVMKCEELYNYLFSLQ